MKKQLAVVALVCAAADAQEFDIVVYGGSPGGIAAALAAARAGRSVALAEYHHHFGGMAASGLGKSLAMALARALRHLRPLFPPEIAGLVVLLVGIATGIVGVRTAFGPTAEGLASQGQELAIALGTLALMVALNVWGSERLRMFCVLIGMAAGYVAAAALGYIRLMTHRAVLITPLDPRRAIDHVRSWLDRPNVRILDPGERHLEILGTLLAATGVATRASRGRNRARRSFTCRLCGQSRCSLANAHGYPPLAGNG